MKNKKQQVMHIMGGEAWKTYDDYIKYLETIEINIDYTKKETKRWYKNIDDFLTISLYQVIVPTMPSKHNSKYNEWKIWFERHFEFLEDNIILIGHSLGGIFLAKYLSENIFPFSIKQLHFVAPVYWKNEDLASFSFEEFPNKFFENNIEEIHIYHSTDDKVVPIADSEKYFEKLSQAYFHRFTDRGHFLDETFPELFENIKNSNKT